MTSGQKKIVDAMKSIGTFKNEYMPTVSRLAEMREQYAEQQKVYEMLIRERPQEFAGYHKPVIIGVLESMRRDILSYERDLGLTPAALKRIDAQNDMPKSSALADALRALT